MKSSREVFAELMEGAVTDIFFMCNGVWYQQKYGVAMGPVLAVFLANIRMKQFEPQVSLNKIDDSAIL